MPKDVTYVNSPVMYQVFVWPSGTCMSNRVYRNNRYCDTVTTLYCFLLIIFGFCFSGLTFLLDQAEVTELVVFSLKEVEDLNKAECMTLRQAFVLLSKGFFCHPQDVATITELHIQVVCFPTQIFYCWKHLREVV